MSIVEQWTAGRWERVAKFVRARDAVAMLPPLARIFGMTVRCTSDNGGVMGMDIPRGVTVDTYPSDAAQVWHYIARP